MIEKKERKGLALLGSTGSIGTQALEVVDRHNRRLRVEALAAYANVDVMEEQARKYRPRLVGMVSPQAASDLKARLEGTGIRVEGGAECLLEAVSLPGVDVVLNAVVGSAGLPPTLETLRAGKRLALANKESMVAGGDLVSALLEKGGELIPVDSEHGAVFHCLRGERREDVERIILTASGGPFRGFSRERLSSVTVEKALDHPTWRMGKKITIDSATLMNKGLEVIEAHYLFGVPYDRIEVVVHPQSVIHSLVEFKDGSMSAQLSLPDMRLPIALALSYPERWAPPFKVTDLVEIGSLTFEEVDRGTFRCLELAYRAGRAGGTAPAVLNAANEVAVEEFLRGRLRFLDIEWVVEEVLEEHDIRPVGNLEDITAAEDWARKRAREKAGEAG
jgi:1-deoxy-D-xylulose-5-phosphate reductoisomerase